MLQTYDPRNRDLIVNINGLLVHRDQARISPFDSAVQGGDAVWEGLRLYRGRIFRLDEHLARLTHSAKALAFTQVPPPGTITHEIRRTLEANRMFDGVHLRLTLTRGEKFTSGMDPRLNTQGPTLIVLAEHKAPVYARSGLSLVTSSVRRFPPDCLDPKIHHNNLLQSILAKIEANVAGADDALMLDQRGFIAETNATHVFLVERRPRAHAAPGRLPRGHHPGVRHRTVPRARHRPRGNGSHADRGLPGGRDVLHGHDGRTRGRDGTRRAVDRRRPAGARHRATVGIVSRTHCQRGHGRRHGVSCRRPRGRNAGRHAVAGERVAAVQPDARSAAACHATCSGMNVWMK